MNKRRLQLNNRARIRLRRAVLTIIVAAAFAIPAAVSALEVDVPYQQTFTNDSDKSGVASTFEYQITSVSESSPMPAGSQNGVYDFSLTGNVKGNLNLDIPFTKPGYYYYTVKSADSPKKGYTYSDKTYTMMIMVVNKDSGIETGAIIIQDSDLAKYDTLTFNTKYYAVKSGKDGDKDGGKNGGKKSRSSNGEAAYAEATGNPDEEPAYVDEETEEPGPAIEYEDTPLDITDTRHWALLNLISMILTFLTVIAALILFLRRWREGDEEIEKESVLRRKGIIRVISIIPAIASLILFILTEDMTLPMRFVDQWTIWMIILLIVALLMALISRRVREEDSSDEGT